MQDNNVNVNASHLRDVFLNAERKYVLELLSNPKIKERVQALNGYDGSTLFDVAKDIVFKVENNLVSEEEMEVYEATLIVVLAAIQDKTLRKELVLLPDFEQDLGRSR